MKSRWHWHGVLSGLAALLALAPAASAHHEVGYGSGLTQGLLHPLTGLDHLLAAIAVGLWAGQRGGRSMLVMPAVFVGALIVGGLFGQAGITIPFAESGIVISVLVLGLLVAAAANTSAMVSASLVTIFAICHGYAHGAEMLILASPMNWMAGLTLGMASILSLGTACSYAARTTERASLIRWAGGAVTAAGLFLLTI